MSANPTPSVPFSFDIETMPGETVIRCKGMLTVEYAETLKGRVKPLISPGSPIQIDLGGVEYVDSAGLGALVSLYMSARTAQCDLKLINFNERIRDLLHITNLLWVLA